MNNKIQQFREFTDEKTHPIFGGKTLKEVVEWIEQALIDTHNEAVRECIKALPEDSCYCDNGICDGSCSNIIKEAKDNLLKLKK